MESCLDSRDLEGSVDCEKGVVGEVRPAAVLALPFALGGNEVESWGEAGFVAAGVVGFFMAEMEM
jgi:hypothetical protein